MKKGIIFILVLMFTVSWAFAEKGAPIQYDPSDYPAPTRQGGETVGDATVIGSLPYNDTGTTAGYVDDYDEVCPYTGSTSPDVVYSYTPTGNITNVIVTLCGDTDYDSKLYIYENTVTPTAPFACNDDECTSALGQSYVSELTGLTFASGNTYYIVVDGYSGGSGNYEIDVTGDAAGNPAISVSPMSISETLDPDEMVVVPLTIENTGTGDLTFNIAVVENSDALGRKPAVNYTPVNHDLSNNEVDPNMTEIQNPYNSDVLFDLQFQYPVGVGGGEAGFETDGNYLYTTKWNGAEFYRYGLDGTYIEAFAVAGASNVRDLAYDGQYFYGAAATTSLYQMDFTPGAEVLVSTIIAPVDCRGIAYDDGANGFWANNWSTDITLFDMGGNVLNSFPVGTAESFYGFAYDDYTAGGPFLWGFSQAPQNTLNQFDIATGLETGVTFDVGALIGTTTGMSGGMFIAEGLVPGFVTIGCMIQNETLVGLELCPGGEDPWIYVTPQSGTVPGGASIVVDVTLNAADLFDITKTADLVISNNAGAAVEVDVTMNVTNGTTTLDPPINVMVDDETGVISWLAPLETIIEDDFDSFTPGDYIAVVGDNWTTWSNAPGGAEDALVTDAQASSQSNSVVVEENQDLVLIMDDYTTGIYSYDMKMYVPSGYCGYFNLQKTSTPGQEWAFQIYYQTDGMAYADMGAEAAYSHPFNHDEWMDLKVIVDLDSDWATYYFNGAEIGGYQWTLGTFGTPGLLQFGGANIFGGANATTTDTPMFYMDDVVLSELQDVTGFNLYLDDMVTPVTTVGDDVTEYMYLGLVEDQTYTAGVSAEYVGGESDIVEVEFTYDPDTSFDPPSNPAAAVDDYNDVIVTWEAPSGAAEWMRWDFAVNNGAAIGLTNPGTFYVASHWNPADLADYDGAEITKIEFFPNELETFTIQIWTGPNAGTLVSSEPVTAVEVGTFQQVILSTPVTINASQELWFGYEIVQAGTTHPAGTDDGPAVQELGDMISLDGTSWTGMSAAYGLDYNWNLAAYVEGSDGEAIVLTKPRKTVKEASRSLGKESNLFSSIQTSNVRNTRSLAGFKVFRDGSEIADIADPTALTYTDESLDAGTYEYTLMAYYTNPDGESILTDPVDATVVLDCPSNFNAQFQDPNVICTWSAPARGIDSYNIYLDGELYEESVSGLMFIDINPDPGTYMYSATTVFDGGWESDPCDEIEVIVPGSSGDDVLKPTVTELTGNYPNPFNPTTTISFSLKEAGHVSINIYNMRGQLVKTLVNTELDRNFHNIVWDGKDSSGKNTSSGVYFYKMKAQNYNSTKKMILMK